MRLVDGRHAQRWDSRGHFFSVAAEGMRRILVESARRKSSGKRGGEQQRVDIKEFDLAATTASNADLMWASMPASRG